MPSGIFSKYIVAVLSQKVLFEFSYRFSHSQVLQKGFMYFFPAFTEVLLNYSLFVFLFKFLRIHILSISMTLVNFKGGSTYGSSEKET